MSLCWCVADPDLLLTCAKDMHLFMWNPNTGQLLAEIPNAARNWPNQVSVYFVYVDLLYLCRCVGVPQIPISLVLHQWMHVLQSIH
jgi:hypothetical protein